MKLSPVYLYVPNIIGYVRLLLLIIGWFFFNNIYVFLPLYSVSAILDGVDGCVARALGQTSAFGAWLDVLVDNVGRSILYTELYTWGIFVACVEWTVFVCTHSTGPSWKQAFGAAPWWVKAVMENGFRTTLGVFTVAGLHVLPIYLYFYEHSTVWPQLSHIKFLLVIPIVILAVGRVVALAVELWCIATHISQLISSEEDRKLRSLTKDLAHSEST